MATVDAMLKRLTRSNERLAQLEQKRVPLQRERDEQVRELLAAGATWAALRETGVSNATIAKARERR